MHCDFQSKRKNSSVNSPSQVISCKKREPKRKVFKEDGESET